MAQKQAEQTGVVQQLTIKTDSGVRTRLDAAGRDAAGNARLTEAKASETARLTPNQRKAFPEIGQTGGTARDRASPASRVAAAYRLPRWTSVGPASNSAHMTVENSEVVDLVGVDRQSENVVLTISDHLTWDSDEHLLVLQDKLNGYLRFIESGELVQQYPDATNRKPQILIVFKHPPSDTGLQFLKRIADVIESAGIAFRYETIPH